MEDAFFQVLIGVVVLGGLASFVAFLGAGKAFDQMGKGGLALRDGSDRPADEPKALGGADAIRDTEARQMLEARNARRLRKGLSPIDVEIELAALLRPAGVDPAVEAEVRDLVVGRNARRLRRGQEPLDVEAEVARQLESLRDV